MLRHFKEVVFILLLFIKRKYLFIAKNVIFLEANII